MLIVGADTFPEVRGWRDAARIFELCALGVVERPGRPALGDEAAPGARVRRATGPALDVSATLVRQRAAAGLSLRYLVPDGVADYIVKRRLYR